MVSVGDDPLRVAVAVLRRPDGRILVAHRDAWRHQGGGLEFPGGKIDPGESALTGLARELREELGITLQGSSPLIQVEHAYPERTVRLETHLVTDWEGEPAGAEGQALEWHPPRTLDHARFPAANRPILASLVWPSMAVILEESDLEDAGRMDALSARLADRPHIVRLRGGAMSLERRLAAAARLSEVVGAFPGSQLMVNAGPAEARRLPPGIGIHLSAADAARIDARPVGREVACSCACHGPVEIAQAERLDVDFAYLGPVRETASHPAWQPLGWPGFRRLARHTPLPLFALGGLGPGDLAEARSHGGVGVAGIRAFLDASRGGSG